MSRTLRVVWDPHLVPQNREIWEDLRTEINLGQEVGGSDLRWPWLWM